jgi:hypothetical protein
LENNWGINENEEDLGSLAIVVKLESNMKDTLWLSTPEEEEDAQDEEDRLFQEALDAV